MNDNEFDLSDQKYWKKYSDINKQFSETICNLIFETELIWINDIELLLVANYIIKKYKSASIGLFFHSSFPSS